MALFQKTVISKYLQTQNPEILLRKWDLLRAQFHNPIIQENIRNSKEEQYQEGFLRDLFVSILGYQLNPAHNFNLTTEYKNVKDSKKADGAIIIDDKVTAIIELKGMNTTDLSKIEDQAFGYKNNQEDCKYVITSNFEKIRFYVDNAIEHIEFNLFELTQEQFNLMYLVLAFENIKNDVPKKLKDESLNQEDIVTKKLYKDYSVFKRELFQNLTLLNPEHDPLVLFQKSQKLLDRLLFLLFGEDRGLLPPNSVRQILEQWNKLNDLDAYDPLYNRYKKYFGYLNTGFKGKNHDVFAYNGGLFKEDKILDHIKIDDKLLYDHTFRLSQYDFASEVDVNILGHIFENSLNEIDEIKAQIEGQVIDKSKSKRKKDGVFYTPKYITKYIVENTVGKLCEEKKDELGIIEEEYFTDKKRQQKTNKNLLDKLDHYRDWLLQLTIVDPACGSGAFLNEALNFLIKEHQYIDELEAKLRNVPIIFSYHSESILEHNLFGVDLNEESVEIAKLSLWLRTAEPNRKLNSLNDNIKCGNSLIDDPEFAGDKAFNWKEEFPQVFAKGGFDVVIGNPPYGAKLEDKDKAVIKKQFEFINPKTNDTYIFFTLKMIDILKVNGFLGLIIPNTWLLINSTKDFRQKILEYNLYELIDYGDNVFDDATVESLTMILKNNLEQNKIFATRKRGNQLISRVKIDRAIWLNDDDVRILLDKNEQNTMLLEKIKKDSNSFDQVAEIIWGIKPYQVGHGDPKQTKEMMTERIYHSQTKVGDSWKPLLVGSNVNRYVKVTSDLEYIKYGRNLMYPSNYFKINSEKLLMRQTSDILRVVYDEENYYPQNSIFIITVSDDSVNIKYLLTLLNSSIVKFYYSINNPQKGKTFAEIKPSIIKKVPIKDISLASQQPFVEKADQMLSLNKSLQEISAKFQRTCERKFENLNLNKKLQDWYNLSYAEFIKELSKQKIKLTLSEEAEWADYFDQEKSNALEIQSEIENTDKEIDKMVYELYGLSEEEIKIVEKS